MNITTDILRNFFMWCTILNGGMLILSSLILVFARDWVYGLHSKLFPMTKEAFCAVIYAFLGFFKIVVIVFNLVPWLALVILGR